MCDGGELFKRAFIKCKAIPPDVYCYVRNMPLPEKLSEEFPVF